ncbi:MAG TPA: hypothetical protein VMX54_00660 [Vicinamibacteria bacterium]|nr:hypothetical protein [Vicinamibacteria bacterium]
MSKPILRAPSRPAWRLLPLLLWVAALVPRPARAEVEPALNAEVGGPQIVSANLGIRVAAGPESWRGYGRGLVFQLQPGVAGGALNVGWMPFSFSAQGAQAIGVGIKARLLRTWGSPWGADPDRTYAGFEAAAVLGVKASVGVLWKIGSGSGRSAVVTWGLGIGF